MSTTATPATATTGRDESADDDEANAVADRDARHLATGARTAPDLVATDPPRAPSQAMGELRINATPWGTVEIGGRRVDTPATITLPAGTYQLKISNPELGTRRSMPVTIRPGASKRLVVDLRR